MSSTLSSASANRAATVPGSCLSQYTLAIVCSLQSGLSEKHCTVFRSFSASSDGLPSSRRDSAVARISMSFGPKCFEYSGFQVLVGRVAAWVREVGSADCLDLGW